MAQLLGARRERARWMLAPFAAFALAFPGVVIGYYTVPGTPVVAPAPGGPIVSFGWILVAGLLSWTVLSACFAVLRRPVEESLLWTAAIAITAYYWFTPVSVAETFGMPPWAVSLMRAATLTLVATWAYRALLSPNRVRLQ